MGSSPPPSQQESAPTSQPAFQSKPKPTYSPKKNNVRIVGGKLFHVEDDVEGPISIQFIGDHPNPGTRGYHVASSKHHWQKESFKKNRVGKPRDGTSAGGQRMNFIV